MNQKKKVVIASVYIPPHLSETYRRSSKQIAKIVREHPEFLDADIVLVGGDLNFAMVHYGIVGNHFVQTQKISSNELLQFGAMRHTKKCIWKRNRFVIPPCQLYVHSGGMCANRDDKRNARSPTENYNSFRFR